MIIPTADRLNRIGEYYVPIKNREIAAVSAKRVADGLEPVISLGVGAPDRMPPLQAIDALCSEAKNINAHKYQNFRGIPELREAMSNWYKRWYGVELEPQTQIQPLMGAKEGILMASLTFLNKGDKVLVPNPGYPTYTSASNLVQAEVMPYDLLPETGFYPDFDALEQKNLDGVKMMWINYPNMPTGAPASMSLYERIVDFGKRHGILICSDNPYSFVRNENPLSIFNVPGAFDCCIELNSLSKAHNMSGWRMGMVCASPEIISEMFKVKSQMDSGMFRPVQIAAVEALNQDDDWYKQLNAEYYARQKVGEKIMSAIGAECQSGSQGLFLWGKLQEDNFRLAHTDKSKTLGERMSDKLLYENGIYVTAGSMFGTNGNDYIRICLCADVSTLNKVLSRL